MKIRLIYATAVVFALMTPTVLMAEDPNDLLQETLKKAEAGDAAAQYEKLGTVTYFQIVSHRKKGTGTTFPPGLSPRREERTSPHFATVF